MRCGQMVQAGGMVEDSGSVELGGPAGPGYSEPAGLVESAARGDEEALERLLQEQYMRVYRLSYRFSGTREDAEDITQEVFVKLAGKLDTFRKDSAFKTWLYRIVVNTATDYLRRNSRRYAREAAYVREQSLNPGNAGRHGGDSDAGAGELLAAVRGLPGKLRDAVLLVHAEGLTHAEAAETLGCAETTVSGRIFQARAKLKKLLGQEV